MGYKLIAFDLDGTLYDRNSGASLTPRTIDAVKRVRRMGAEVTIATGRMFNSTLPFSAELGLEMPIICYQGALIGDPVTKEVIWERPIPLAEAHRLICLLESMDVSPYVFVRDRFYISQRTPRVERYEEALHVKAEPVGDLVTHLWEEPTKVVAVGEEPQMVEVVREVKDTFGSSLSVIHTYGHLCEIGHPEGSKAQALSHLAGMLGVGRDETVAAGDSPNDIDMIRWAGLGVAMASASPEVREVADLVVKPASDDGVAELLESLIARGQISPLR